MTTTTGASRIVSTAAPRGIRSNPGERDHVLGYLRRANRAGRDAAAFPTTWPATGCPDCRDPEVRTDGAGRRIVRPCGTCGAVRG